MNKKTIILVTGLILLVVGTLFFTINKNKKSATPGGENFSEKKEDLPKDTQLQDGYSKAWEIIDKKDNPQLKAIFLFHNKERSQDRLEYVFITEKEMEEIGYDLSSKEVQPIGRREKQLVKNEDGSDFQQVSFTKNDYPEISKEILDFSLNEIQNILNNNEDYVRYKQKYPKLFDSYSVVLEYDDKYKWEWKYNFYEIDSQEENNVIRSIGFAVNIEEKKAVLIGKNNID